MTLIKSLLLGSAAGIVAVVSAQAADLPTRKAAPVEYVRVCNVGGITGWTLPGSDTCVKLSATSPHSSRAATSAPDTTTARSKNAASVLGSRGSHRAVPPRRPWPDHQWDPSGLPYDTHAHQRVLIAASAFKNQTFYRNEVGWTTRANFGFDMASNTAYGPLIGHFDINSEAGNGLDNVNNTYLNTGYLVDHITAGKAQSFYSFTGGDNWAEFLARPEGVQAALDLLELRASKPKMGMPTSAPICSPRDSSEAEVSQGADETVDVTIHDSRPDLSSRQSIVLAHFLALPLGDCRGLLSLESPCLRYPQSRAGRLVGFVSRIHWNNTYNRNARLANKSRSR